MDVELDLRILERREDRVVVALRVRPSGDDVSRVEGATVHLLDVDGEELCPQVLLPLPGPLSCVGSANVELRANRRLPDGCRVVAVVWQGSDQASVSCPADPDVSLAGFLCGARHRLPAEDAVELFTLDAVQRASLEACWPWVAGPVRAAEASAVLDPGPVDPDAATLGEDLGLDAASAEWLHDLLQEADV